MHVFRREAFRATCPAQLPFQPKGLPEACRKWFVHDQGLDDTHGEGSSASSELNLKFWRKHESTIVPLEVNTTDPQSDTTTFHRSDAPLRLFLDWMTASKTTFPSSRPACSVYLAQCQLSSLPTTLQNDLPTPDIVLASGRGDIYDTNLWIGRPPTYTPLHRDPNPNLFMQLAGQKVVRLFPPDVGKAIFDGVQEKLASSSGRAATSSVFRGEEMMQGAEKELLEQEIWGGKHGDEERWFALGFQARLGLGEALFIPKGWWHSIKGVGNGATASVNWWFR